jgi:septal ring factor EnvC (AmiA/AmiB activator)
MAKEPHDLTATLPREIRGDLAHLRARADETATDMRALRKQIHDWQGTTATATGFAMRANVRGQALEDELADLPKRVEKLEKAR